MASTPEQRLFGRIVVLTFLLGLVSGLWGLLIGVSLYKSPWLSSGMVIPHPSGWPLEAFQIILDGAVMVLFMTVSDLCTQFTQGIQWKNGRHIFFRFCDRFVRIMGFFLMGEGVVVLLDKPLSLLYPEQEPGISLFLILFVPLCIIVLSWYVFVRGKRRSQQLRVKEEGVLPVVCGDEESQRDLEGAD